MGTRRIVLKMPFLLKCTQKGVLLRIKVTSGLLKGIKYFPRERFFEGLRIRAEERSGRYVRVSRLRKSKILCLPGLEPVLKEDQATGDIEGLVLARIFLNQFCVKSLFNLVGKHALEDNIQRHGMAAPSASPEERAITLPPTINKVYLMRIIFSVKG